MKRFYYYMFYRFYKLALRGDFNWMPAFRASLTLLILEVWLAITIMGFISLIFDVDVVPPHIFNWQTLLLTTALIALKFFCFDKKEKWKKYNVEFESLSNRAKVWGTVLFISVILLIVAGFVWMLFLTGKNSGTI